MFTSDGNGSLYAFYVPGAAPGSTSSALNPGQLLSPGQYIASINGLYALVMQTDGNLVEYNSSGRPLWASNTRGNMSAVVLQSDGNLVMYNTSGRAVWANNRSGLRAALVLQHDSNVVEYAGPRAVWASGS